jgi:hypothetical protein
MYCGGVDLEIEAVQRDGSRIVGDIKVDNDWNSQINGCSKEASLVFSSPVPLNLNFSKSGSNVKS